MSPAALILVFVSCWSIAVVGAYLMVMGLGNLREHRLASRPPGVGSPLLFLRQRLFLLWDLFLLLMGTLLAASAMLFLYIMVYG